MLRPARADDDRAFSYAMLVEPHAGGAAAAQRALAGLAKVLRRQPHGLVFIGLPGDSSAGSAVWRAARELGVLDRLSLVPDLEAAREPILHVDLLLLPAVLSGGAARHTLMLEAMAEGVAVVAGVDPLNDDLIDGRTASIVAVPTEQSWAEAISALVDHPSRLRALQESAQSFVRTDRTAAAQVAGVLECYSLVAPGGAAPVRS